MDQNNSLTRLLTDGRAHPSLQGNLLDFLEGLPRGRLGAWVCSGWEGVIKEAEMTQRFEQLLTPGARMVVNF
jgi:hypothetical protein